MEQRIFKTFCLCLATLLCAASLAYAATECSIVQSSIPWDEEDQETWISDAYQLTIECLDSGSPVENYQAQFNLSLMEGTTWNNNIANLTAYSTLTNSEGIAYINVPLMHVQKDDEAYIHICPFDDIECTGGVSSSSQVAPTNSSAVALLTAASTNGCTNTNTVSGCCETTITITCCTPNRVFTYCSATTEEQCVTGTTNPDSCTTITTTWTPSGICDYCTGLCEDVTAITLASFSAKAGNGVVALRWETETEIDNAGFNILRAESEDGAYVKINDALIPAQGGATAGASYVYTDTGVKNRTTYYYKLEDVDLNGISTMHGPVSATPRIIYGIIK